VIRVDDVTVRFGEATILDAVSFTVEKGEIVGLVGPNGAGKTTCIRTINGYLTPDAGSVTVAGEPVAHRSAREVGRLVATVSQDTSVAFDFSVEHVVEMGRTPYHSRFGGDPDGPEAVARALDRTETAALADRSVSELSGGERQRAFIAQALAQETPALLLDEPTASLDINHQVATLDLVTELAAADDIAVLTAIHDLDLAARYCDRLVLLADGTVRAVGPPADVLRSARLDEAFGVSTAVTTDPATGTERVTPLSESDDYRETLPSQSDAAERELPVDD